MISVKAFTAAALGFPEAKDKPHFDRTAFYVDAPKGKTFVTLAGDEASANIVFTREQQDMLCAAEPDMFAPVPNKWGEKGWTTMTLAALDTATLQSALTMAWMNAAPTKLHDRLSV